MRQYQRLVLSILLLLPTAFVPTVLSASNQLGGHPSPYLALHAGDPVDWQTLNSGVFEQARADNRLVLVSVGYFSCHWCHVMQQQSYQHAPTAEFLNQHFISVKVDRELDPDWQTPHYEKMLYDNALLAELYLKAHRIWPDRGYAEIALRTLDFIETNLKHENGGYMSSLSAVDRDNREGGAYLWSSEQLSALLEPAELAYLQQIWQLQSQPAEFLILPLNVQAQPAESGVEQSILRKLQSRGSGSMPVDDKRLASWNAMMLSALTAAADIEPRFAVRAKHLLERMRDIFFADGSLIRFAGNVDIADAVFEDYAYTALAFLRYGQRFADNDAIELARLLCERAHDLFLVDGRWQAKAESLIPMARGKWIIEDRVFYSPMTLWLQVALAVPDLDPALRDSARAMLQRATREMLANPYHYGSFIMLRGTGADR
ncbi:MAG: thioredoxin domain-containing protein [Gammaproteobacteria bacterium]|nr:thioredoxin domain-containing protein [Gammaproteobacteria bacterium]